MMRTRWRLDNKFSPAELPGQANLPSISVAVVLVQEMAVPTHKLSPPASRFSLPVRERERAREMVAGLLLLSRRAG